MEQSLLSIDLSRDRINLPNLGKDACRTTYDSASRDISNRVRKSRDVESHGLKQIC